MILYFYSLNVVLLFVKFEGGEGEKLGRKEKKIGKFFYCSDIIG